MRLHPRTLWRRWWFWAIALVLLIIVLCIAWIGLRALAAKSELEAAQLQVSALKADATAQKFGDLSATLTTLKKHSSAATELTSDPIWRFAEGFPKFGRNLTVVRELAAATNDVVDGTISPLVSVASALTPKSFAPVNGALNLDPLTRAVPALAKANQSLKSTMSVVERIDTAGTIAAVSGAKTKLAGLLSGVAPLLDNANTFLPLIPQFMGATQPRNYVVIFQNNAESRSLGGTALSFATLSIDKGKIHLASTISAGSDHFDNYVDSAIPVPEGVDALYEGAFGHFIANATVRPQFSSAAQIVMENWKRKFGTSVDGVISMDPVALSYVLRATTPIQISSGDILTPDSLVPLLLNGVYLRFNTGHVEADSAAWKVLYAEAVAATFTKLSGGSVNAKVLIAALIQGRAEGRVSYWSSHPDEQSVLAKANLSTSLPVSDATTDRVGVYFQDNVGSKLNYYLNQTVHTGQAVCRADGRATYRIGVDLTSTVPVNTKLLSPAILGNWKSEKLKPGVQRMFVYVYAPPGTQIARATIAGVAVPVTQLHDEKYPVARLLVAVAPGASVSTTVDIVAAKPGSKALEASATPMVNKTSIVPTPLDCATVSSK